jgi:hypothetical protein
MTINNYPDSLRRHYEEHFGVKGIKHVWPIDPHKKIHADFYILEFPPNKKHDMWIYCTVGMSMHRTDENLIEVFIFSSKKDNTLVELLTLISSYHMNGAPLNIHHTFNIGRPWLDNSLCDYGFISLPYLDGEQLEIFKFENNVIHCYWIIPITESEQEYKIEKGCDALEDLFEEKGIQYLNPSREPLI